MPRKAARTSKISLTKKSRIEPICSLSLVKRKSPIRCELGTLQGRPFALSFTAFGGKAKTVSRDVAVGDRLFVEYLVEYRDPTASGEGKYSFRFMVGASMTRTQLSSKLRTGELSAVAPKLKCPKPLTA